MMSKITELVSILAYSHPHADDDVSGSGFPDFPAGFYCFWLGASLLLVLYNQKKDEEEGEEGSSGVGFILYWIGLSLFLYIPALLAYLAYVKFT